MFTRRSISSLISTLSSKVLEKRQQLSRLSSYGHYPVADQTVLHLLEGQKNIKSQICETSQVTSSGLQYRELSIHDVLSDLPGSQKLPSAESLFWLLLTGEVPSYSEFSSFKSHLSKYELPSATESFIVSLPKDLHPMTQFSMALCTLSPHSKYSKEFAATAKQDRWKLMLEDSVFLFAVLPKIAALVYRGTFKDGKLGNFSNDESTDLVEKFSRMIGWNDEKFFEAMRLFMVIHADHEGSNVSTHASRLVASAGGNLFDSFAAGLNGLAGFSHGMGMQNCLMWLVEMWRALGENIDEKTVEVYIRSHLMRNEKIPGFGHPVLKTVDERFVAQLEFAKKHLKSDPLCDMIRIISQVAPRLQKELHLPVQYPNMYLHSAAILFHYGFRMYEYYTVLFGLSRFMGISSNIVWDVALELPSEELDSVTLEELEKIVKNK